MYLSIIKTPIVLNVCINIKEKRLWLKEMHEKNLPKLLTRNELFDYFQDIGVEG